MVMAMQVTTQAMQQRALLEQAVASALAQVTGKADSAEVAVRKTSGINVTTRHAEVENVEFNSDGTLGITVYHQQRKGSASSSDLSEAAISRTVQAAVDIARYTSADPCAGIADKALLAFQVDDLDLFHPQDIQPQQAIEFAAHAEQRALQADHRIINTEGGSFSSHYSIQVFANSHGMLQSYCSSRHSLSACVIASENGHMERDYAWTTGRALDDLHSADWVGDECARRTLARLSPRKLATMKTPVIFSRELAGEFFGHLVPAISGEAIYRKSSFLLDALGHEIFPHWLSIAEYPHWRKGLASAPFDAEGVATTQLSIIDKGVLQQWLLSSYSARKLGLVSNGHAGGIYNWQVNHSDTDFSALLQQMGRGLLVTELMGSGVNYITGDYSRGASGYWVEHGEIQYPVSEITISGNLSDMWRDIVTIASDVERRGCIQSGSVLIEQIQVAGQ